MCQNLILLATNNHHQFVFVCEHGTVHITHQITTLCMGTGAFRKLLIFLERSDTYQLDQPGSLYRLIEADDGCFELWIGSGGLRLTVVDYLTLLDVLRIAAKRLDQQLALDHQRRIALKTTMAKNAPLN